MADTLLKVKGLKVAYGGIQAVKGVDMEVREGEQSCRIDTALIGDYNIDNLLGVIGALFDEASGGFGGSAFDIGVVFAEVGKALAVGPFLGTLLAGRTWTLELTKQL